MKKSNFRWMICSLLFFATTVNYLDRQVLSLTWKDFIAPEFKWTDADYGIITGYFSLIYAFCNLFAGKFVDWMGTKKGYMWAIFVWSLAACLHAATGVGSVHLASALALSITSVSVWLFLGCRCLLALGEAGNFPAAVKVTAEYFPPKDRAYATSIFNAGSSVGALVAPATIPLLAEYWGWETAFIVIGALGFVWMGFWQVLYKKPAENPRVNAAELAYINQDGEAEGRSGILSASEQREPSTVRSDANTCAPFRIGRFSRNAAPSRSLRLRSRQDGCIRFACTRSRSAVPSLGTSSTEMWKKTVICAFVRSVISFMRWNCPFSIRARTYASPSPRRRHPTLSMRSDGRPTCHSGRKRV